ncbi:MAG: hypothetical protein WEB37_08145 [Bacteroidota bacterium]
MFLYHVLRKTMGSVTFSELFPSEGMEAEESCREVTYADFLFEYYTEARPECGFIKKPSNTMEVTMRPVAALLILLAGLSVSLSAQALSAIQGAWRASQIQTTGPTAATYAPQPSLYLFAGRHYSIVSVDSREARPQFRDPANFTESEALEIWSPFTGQAGTFEVVGSELRTMPTVAKNPHVMGAGRQPDVYRISLQGDTMTLTGVSNRLGPVANPITQTLVRVR